MRTRLAVRAPSTAGAILLLVATGCGRIGYDPLGPRRDASAPPPSEASVDSGGGSSQDAPAAPDATAVPDAGTDAVGSADAAAEGEASTVIAVCGDGVVEPGEQCDEGPGTRVAIDPCTMACTYNWWNTAWTYRRRILLDNRAQTIALGSFPVAVQLTAAFDYPNAQAAGQDIRFVDADDLTVLPYESELFHDASGASVLWVRVPTIDAASNADYVWMYYGNAAAGPGQQPAQVWNTKFRRVWHMAGTAVDSAGFGAPGTIVAATTAPGQLGSGLSFDGVTAHVDEGSAADVTNLLSAGATLSAWMNPAGWGGTGFGRVLDKSAGINAQGGWGWELNQTGSSGPDNALRLEQGYGAAKGGWETPLDSISLGSWVHVAVRYWGASTSNTPTFFINGVAQTTTTATAPTGTPADDTGQPLWIGNFSGDLSRGFDGVLDEVRIEADTRPDDWIRAEYQFSLPAYVQLQAEQKLGN